jgi:hypothetical protein
MAAVSLVALALPASAAGSHHPARHSHPAHQPAGKAGKATHGVKLGPAVKYVRTADGRVVQVR